MSLVHWLSTRLCLSPRPASKRMTPAARPTVRPTLEALEDRYVPSTLTVTSATDSGGNSLRAKIAAAHDGDTIAFASNLDGRTITLTKGELFLNKNLTITGFDDHKLTISGKNSSRIFEVAAGSQVNLSGLTISNGLAKAGNGGGVLVDSGAMLDLSKCNLSDNSASFNRKGVGGLGSAIYNAGTTTVSDCTLTGNATKSPSGGNSPGGVIRNVGSLTVNDNTVVSQNSNTGIENFGTALLDHCTVSGNTAVGSSGGGVSNENGATLIAQDCFLLDNSCSIGAGLYNNGTAQLFNCTVSGNTATSNGGGIWSTGSAATLEISGGTISDNSAGAGSLTHGNGGGIEVFFGTATITDCHITDNSADGAGGGIYLAQAQLTLIDSIMSENSAILGGGLYIVNSTATVKQDSKIIDNQAPAGYSADDVKNRGELDVDSTSTVGIVDGNPPQPI